MASPDVTDKDAPSRPVGRAGPADPSGLRDRLPEEIPGLLRYARTITRDPQQAEDLVQDTLVRALEQADSIESRWHADSYTVDAAVVVERAHSRFALRDALVHLPVVYRTAVVLPDAEGLPMSEVAEIRGVGLPATKQRLRRGRMMMVSLLAAESQRREALKGTPLRCWEARSQVSDYMDGELDARRRALLE